MPQMFDMVMMAHTDGDHWKNRRTMEEAAYDCWFLNFIELLQQQWLIEAFK
jgi:hypothetical protein